MAVLQLNRNSGYFHGPAPATSEGFDTHCWVLRSHRPKPLKQHNGTPRLQTSVRRVFNRDLRYANVCISKWATALPAHAPGGTYLAQSIGVVGYLSMIG